jgi:hypothetical protein
MIAGQWKALYYLSIPPVPFALVILEIGSHIVFMLAGL